MIIGIDGNEANVDQRVGVHQYAYHILWGLKKLNQKRRKKHNFLIYLQTQPKKHLPKQDFYWKYKVIPAEKYWILRKLTPNLLIDRRLDVFFAPSHYLPPFPLSLPTVCTIHDLGYLRFSDQFQKIDFWQLKLWTAISISISKYIMTVSQFSKKDIVRHYPKASRKIHVAYHGCDKAMFDDQIPHSVVRRVARKYHIPDAKNYMLFLGMLKPSKNVEGLLVAFSKVVKKHKDMALVIAGKHGWMFDTIFKKVKELKIDKKVIFTGYISEKDKPALMKGAKCLVSPSFWEGFGIHVLESMAVGTPVVVSNVASLPEVAGEAGIYVDPKNVKSIEEGMGKLLSMSKNRYNNLVTKSLSQARKFSWEKAAQKTLKVIERAGKGKKQ